jgi:hypothetical protein
MGLAALVKMTEQEPWSARDMGTSSLLPAGAITWSEQNPEAIAGLHNKGRRAFALFDEASAIPDPVWDTSEGALTDADTELFWSVFGNPCMMKITQRRSLTRAGRSDR